MGFTWSEIKKWAKDHNLEPKKIKEGGYSWQEKNYINLDDLVKDLWNKISDNKWVDHQQNIKENLT